MSGQTVRETERTFSTGATPQTIEDSEALRVFLASAQHEGEVVRTPLMASNRVIARVTDGIYREPASALRDLISNAWDADAKTVTIHTDAPRFSRITIGDDGLGMSHAVLARLVHMIGGSAKRTAEGQELGVTSENDPDRTPSGRLLIGKIGIGLFSVSQLARSFRIITKRAGENYRLVAEVRLRTFSEDTDEDFDGAEDETHSTGEVFIVRQHAEDTAAHGTDIIIDEVKPGVQAILRSAARWEALDQIRAANENPLPDDLLDRKIEEPRYHAGWIGNLKADTPTALLTVSPQLPWDSETPASERMAALMDAVQRETTRIERPDLGNTLDTYLRTLWTLGLSSPVRYVDQHPFDITSDANVRIFWISNDTRGQAKEVGLKPDQTVREAVKEQVPGSPELTDGLAEADFRVLIDGVELRRPIRFNYIRTDRRGIDTPLLLVGRYDPDLKRISPDRRGGDLSLEAYLFWNSRIVPKENNGVLVRIRGASGALFDPTFFNYQVSEQTRLKQITSELFIQRGLDAALNIDRESFNFSHPHVVLVTRWTQRAIRQLTNKHKDLSQSLLSVRRAEEAVAVQGAISRYAAHVWSRRQGSEPLPEVQIAADPAAAIAAREEGALAVVRSEIGALAQATPSERADRQSRTQALIRILAAFGVLTDRSYDEQQALVDAILGVFYTPNEHE